MPKPIRLPPAGILISYPILKEFPHSSPPPSTITSFSPSISGLYLGYIESYQPPSLYTPSSSLTKKRRTKNTTALDHGHYRARFLDGDINDYTPAEAWEGVVTFVEQYTTFIDGPHQTMTIITKKDVFGKGARDVVTQQTMMEYWERRLKSWRTKDSKDKSSMGRLTREDVKTLDREWRECWEEYRKFMIKGGVLEPTGSLVDGLTGRVRSLMLLEEEGDNKGTAVATETTIVEGVTMDDIAGTRIMTIEYPEEERESFQKSTTTSPIIETSTLPSKQQQQQQIDNKQPIAKQTSSLLSKVEKAVEIVSQQLQQQQNDNKQPTARRTSSLVSQVENAVEFVVINNDTPDLVSLNGNDLNYCIGFSSSSLSDVKKEVKRSDGSSKTDTNDDDNFLMVSPGRERLGVEKKGSMGGNEEMARTTKPPTSTPSTLPSSSSPDDAITPNPNWLCLPITNTHTLPPPPPLPSITISPSPSKPITSGECDVCLFTFPHLSEHRFAIHRLTPTQYLCPYCDAPEKGPWKTPEGRLRHIFDKHSKYATKALEIPSSTRPPAIWRSGASYRCPFCPFRSTNSGLMGVDYHVRNKHMNVQFGEHLENMVKRFCPFCRPGIDEDVYRIFHSREELERHVKEDHDGCILSCDIKLPGMKSQEGKFKKREREEKKIKAEKKDVLEKKTVKKQRQQPIKRKRGRKKKGSGSDVPVTTPAVVSATLSEEALPPSSPESTSNIKKTNTEGKTKTKKLKPSKSPSPPHTNTLPISPFSSPPPPSSPKKRNSSSSPLPSPLTVIRPDDHLSALKRTTTTPPSWKPLRCIPPIPNVKPRIRLLQRKLELKNAYTPPEILYDEKVYSEHLKERKNDLRDEKKRRQKQEEKEKEETTVFVNEAIDVENVVVIDLTDESMENDYVDVNGTDDRITVPIPIFRKLDDNEKKKQYVYPPDSDDEREEFFTLKEISHRMTFCREYNQGYGHSKVDAVRI